MLEPEVDKPAEFFFKQEDEFTVRGSVDERDTLMDLDLDMDESWPLDQIASFVSNPMSPSFISVSDQPYSPLWAFSDVNDDGDGKLSADPSSVLGTVDSNSVTQKPTENIESRIRPPLRGLASLENPDGYCLIKERMTRALRHFKESTDQHVLAQVWAPVKKGGRYVLTTSEQPFVLDAQSNGLNHYRMVSLRYIFFVDGEADEGLGLPGRVYRQKLPEWTPNVQYYSSREYPRLSHALHYNVQGTLALPVFETSGQSCVGVLELILTSPKINYGPEVDKICKALEAVNLKSSEILNHPNIQIYVLGNPFSQICNEGRQNALTEILEVLTVVCETHNLPLAQPWVPCRHRSVLAHGGGFIKSCTSFDGSCMGQVCMSTTDVAFYVVDATKWGFREACLEHHLQKGQGVPGRAFLSQSSCFCRDITQFCKTEYPLVHYALMFGLKSCFAICLQSSFTGDDDYILEFFLPPSITEYCEQKTLLGSLLGTMKQHFRTLKVASGTEFEKDEGFVEIIQASIGEGIDSRFEYIQIPQSMELPSGSNTVPNAQVVELDAFKENEPTDFDALNDGNNADHEGRTHDPVPYSENRDTKKTTERKRGKTEKSISLEVLQQYFTGSLKDAARSLGVCPTTMKRICRQHGISRWPSRKINKVNRSLSKLKRVIESVQVAEGSFALTSLTKSPHLVVGTSTSPATTDRPHQQNSPSENKESPILNTRGNDIKPGIEDLSLREGASSPEEPINIISNRSKTQSGSREESTGTPTSHGSCQGSPVNERSPTKDPIGSPNQNQCIKEGNPPKSAFLPNEKPNPSVAYTIPDEPFGGMLIEDSGSSKDLRNLCPSIADAILDEQAPGPSLANLPDLAPGQYMDSIDYTMPLVKQEMKRRTIKASYKEDIIRFRVPFSCGIFELKEEVAKRLKLEMGTFDIKYMDDDQEWVLIACDADLQECVDVSKSSGSNMIRLLIHDITTNLGSSVESTW